MTRHEAMQSARKKLAAFHLDATPLEFTHAELDAMAEDAVADLKADAEAHGYKEDDADRTRFTCHACAHAPRCELVYDLYNTDGDCLADK